MTGDELGKGSSSLGPLAVELFVVLVVYAL
jgi:hypothetical protein